MSRYVERTQLNTNTSFL